MKGMRGSYLMALAAAMFAGVSKENLTNKQQSMLRGEYQPHGRGATGRGLNQRQRRKLYRQNPHLRTK